MLSFIAAIDWWIIGRFEAFSHWTQRNLGLTSVEWQRLFLAAAAVERILGVGFAGLEGAFTVFFLLMFSVDFIKSFKTLVPRESDDAPGMNPEKARSRCIRPICLIGGLYFGGLYFLPSNMHTFIGLWYQLFMVSWYFECCDDLPPGVSRLKALLKSMSFRPKTAEASV